MGAFVRWLPGPATNFSFLLKTELLLCKGLA
jgi:hypothetical protein